MASRQVFPTNQACDLILQFEFTEPDGETAIDIDNATGIFVVKKECAADDGDALFSTTTILIPDGTDGKCYVLVPATTMRTWSIVDAWKLFAQLRLALSSGRNISSDVLILRVAEDA